MEISLNDRGGPVKAWGVQQLSADSAVSAGNKQKENITSIKNKDKVRKTHTAIRFFC